MTGFHNISIPNMPREFLPPSPTPQTAPAVPTLSGGQGPVQKSPVPSGQGCLILGGFSGRWDERRVWRSWLGLGVRPGRPPGLGVGESLAPSCSVGRLRVEARVPSGCLPWPSPPSSHGQRRMHSQTHANAGMKCDRSRPDQKEQAHNSDPGTLPGDPLYTRTGPETPAPAGAPPHCPASHPHMLPMTHRPAHTLRVAKDRPTQTQADGHMTDAILAPATGRYGTQARASYGARTDL